MMRILSIALAGAAMTVAAPAYAALTPTNPAFDCTVSQVTPTADNCAGWYEGNLNGMPANQVDADVLAALQILDPSITSYSVVDYLEDISGNVIDFGTMLSGKVIIGVHKGGAGDFIGNATAFFLWNDLSPTEQITLNVQGLSNATLYMTSVVPEPATWMLMIAGVGLVGFAIRRQKQQVRAKLNFA